MRKAAGIMYLIGKIFSGIKIFVEVAALVLGPIILTNKERAFEILTNIGVEGISSIEDVQKMALTMIVGAVIALVVEIVVLCFAVKADKMFDNKELKIWPHIVMIVFGSVCIALRIAARSAAFCGNGLCIALGLQPQIAGRQYPLVIADSLGIAAGQSLLAI